MRFQMCYNNIHKALGDIFMSHISLEVNHKHFRDLYLCFCGIHDCEPSHSFGPAIRPNYLLHFVIKGKGNYYLNDNCYEVKENECFLCAFKCVIITYIRHWGIFLCHILV